MKTEAQLRAQVDRVVDAGVLGRGTALEKLLIYLAERAYSGKPAKEIEVAMEVFGRNASFDVTQDAFVRVYMHKLRAKLEQYYQNEGSKEKVRLVVPKGQYLLELADNGGDRAWLDIWGSWLGQIPTVGWVIIALTAVLTATLASLISFNLSHQDDQHQLVNHPFWRPMLDGHTPVTLVVGDLFVFSEVNQSFEQLREIRDFSISSRQDFDALLRQNPDFQTQYRSFGQSYLPPAIATGLSAIIPLIDAAGNPLRVVQASQLQQADLESSHLIYLGYFSSLSLLRGQVFEPSRFRLHPNASVLIDQVTGDVYAGEGVLGEHFSERYFDYALLSSQRLANGKQLRVFAAARSPGLERLVRLATSQSGLNQSLLGGMSTLPENFELLLEVSGNETANLQNQVRVAEPLRNQPNP